MGGPWCDWRSAGEPSRRLGQRLAIGLSMPEASYLALLRGVNVGGKNLIRMADLKARLEAMGLTGVRTYIQSGNVVFASTVTRKARLAADLERALGETFAYASRVVLVTAGEIETVVAQAPVGFGSEPATYRYDVLFLKEPLTPREALSHVTTKAGVDTAHAGDHALYFRRLISKAAQSHLTKLVQRPVYRSMTIRNWSTTTALLAMVRGEPPQRSAGIGRRAGAATLRVTIPPGASGPGRRAPSRRRG